MTKKHEPVITRKYVNKAAQNKEHKNCTRIETRFWTQVEQPAGYHFPGAPEYPDPPPEPG